MSDQLRGLPDDLYSGTERGPIEPEKVTELMLSLFNRDNPDLEGLTKQQIESARMALWAAMNPEIPVLFTRTRGSRSQGGGSRFDPDQGTIHDEATTINVVTYELGIGQNESLSVSWSWINATDKNPIDDQLKQVALENYDLRAQRGKSNWRQSADYVVTHGTELPLEPDVRYIALKTFIQGVDSGQSSLLQSVADTIEQLGQVQPSEIQAVSQSFLTKAKEQQDNPKIRELLHQHEFYTKDFDGKIEKFSELVRDVDVAVHGKYFGRPVVRKKGNGVYVEFQQKELMEELGLKSLIGKIEEYKRQMFFTEDGNGLSDTEALEKAKGISHEINLFQKLVERRLRLVTQGREFKSGSKTDVIRVSDEGQVVEKRYFGNGDEDYIFLNEQTDILVQTSSYYKSGKNSRGVLSLGIDLPEEGRLTEAQIEEIQNIFKQLIYSNQTEAEAKDQMAKMYGYRSAEAFEEALNLNNPEGILNSLQKIAQANPGATIEWQRVKIHDNQYTGELVDADGTWVVLPEKLGEPVQIPDLLLKVAGIERDQIGTKPAQNRSSLGEPPASLANAPELVTEIGDPDTSNEPGNSSVEMPKPIENLQAVEKLLQEPEHQTETGEVDIDKVKEMLLKATEKGEQKRLALVLIHSGYPGLEALLAAEKELYVKYLNVSTEVTESDKRNAQSKAVEHAHTSTDTLTSLEKSLSKATGFLNRDQYQEYAELQKSLLLEIKRYKLILAAQMRTDTVKELASSDEEFEFLRQTLYEYIRDNQKEDTALEDSQLDSLINMAMD